MTEDPQGGVGADAAVGVDRQARLPREGRRCEAAAPDAAVKRQGAAIGKDGAVRLQSRDLDLVPQRNTQRGQTPSQVGGPKLREALGEPAPGRQRHMQRRETLRELRRGLDAGEATSGDEDSGSRSIDLPVYL